MSVFVIKVFGRDFFVTKRAFDTDGCVEEIQTTNNTLNSYQDAMTNGTCVPVKLYPVSNSFTFQIQLCNFFITLEWNTEH